MLKVSLICERNTKIIQFCWINVLSKSPAWISRMCREVFVPQARCIKSLQQLSCSHRTHVALQTDPPLPSMPCRELATECTPDARWNERCTAPRKDVKISFRFHSCFKISLATGCMGIYFPWMDNAPRRVCVCVHCAPKDCSLVNKGLTDFNLQRCQADLRKPGSWYINSAEGPIVNLHFMHRYGEIYGCGFRAFVQVLHLQVAITTAILWLYSWTSG